VNNYRIVLNAYNGSYTRSARIAVIASGESPKDARRRLGYRTVVVNESSVDATGERGQDRRHSWVANEWDHVSTRITRAKSAVPWKGEVL
jgi:hypothetical protein